MIRKQLIMDESLKLFASQGFKATSIQQITDNCGISKGAFYLSFKSKGELIIALIDHFMKEIISDIDYVVNMPDEEELLYSFYYTIIESFQKRSDFGRILIHEQNHSLNEELFEKVRYYNTLIDRAILLMIDRLYGVDVAHTKYDLMYCVKSFMNMYSKLFLLHDKSLLLDLDLLAHSLVEKTELIAKQASIPFITKEIYQASMKLKDEEELSKEQLVDLLDVKIKEMDESIEKESLMLLKQHIHNPTLSPAIISGLLENIQKHTHCKWISYLLRSYFQI